MINIYNYPQRLHVQKNKPVYSDGFTLVEMLIVVFILSIIMTGLFLTFNIGQFSFPITSAKLELQSEARNIMNWITKDLHQAITGNIADNNATTNYIKINLWEWNYTTNLRDTHNNAYIEYFYNGTSRKLTRQYTDASGGVSTLEFSNITESPFCTNLTTGILDRNYLRTNNKLNVIVSVEKIIRGTLSVPFILISEVTIRNG